MSKSGLLARQKAERELWTIKVIAYTEQQTLDAVCLALAEGFGFGEERLKRFHDAFNAKYAEIRELEKRDTKDNEYAIAKQEAALKAACGKYYSPPAFPAVKLSAHPLAIAAQTTAWPTMKKTNTTPSRRFR